MAMTMILDSADRGQFCHHQRFSWTALFQRPRLNGHILYFLEVPLDVGSHTYSKVKLSDISLHSDTQGESRSGFFTGCRSDGKVLPPSFAQLAAATCPQYLVNVTF